LYHDEEGKGELNKNVGARSSTTSFKGCPAELFKAGETVLDRMHRICVVIWETGEWPEEWTVGHSACLSHFPRKGS